MLYETNRAKLVGRLKRDGWIEQHGGRHDLFVHAAKPGVRLVVPRHRTLSSGVARDIARKAGW